MQRIIVISGLPGSGKSSLAEALAAKLKLPLLSVDPIESAIIKAGFDKNNKTGLAAYLVAKDLAIEQIKTGNSVIIDAVNAEEDAKDTWRSLAEDSKLSLILVETFLDETEHRRRIEARVRNLQGIPEVTWDKVIERRNSYTQWKEPTMKVDSSKNLSANLNSVINYLQASAS